MYYVAHGSIPRQRHTQHRAAGRQPLRRGAVRGRGLHRPQLAALPPRRRRRGPTRSSRSADQARGRRRRPPSPSPDEDRRRRAEGRRDHRPDPAVLQQRRRVRRRPPGRGRCRRARSTATASPTRCSSSTRAPASATRSSGRCATARATTSSCRSARPGGSIRTRAPSSGCCTSRRRRRSSRRSAIATTTASSSSTRRTRSATSTRPTTSAPRDETGEFVIHVRSTDRITAYHYRHHPFDVVGWDGYLWPFRFNIADFQPITGRVHQPPPVHQTFQARNFVVCSFVPRKFDYHPLAIPAPYNHSNINSDEVIYYVAGNFMSRRGVDIASFTLHPAGIPHGPHPGTVEASIGKEATEELAVMVDTFHPLQLTQAAMDLDDDRYPYTLAAARGRRRRGRRARRARPGGVPGLTRATRCLSAPDLGASARPGPPCRRVRPGPAGTVRACRRPCAVVPSVRGRSP